MKSLELFDPLTVDRGPGNTELPCHFALGPACPDLSDQFKPGYVGELSVTMPYGELPIAICVFHITAVKIKFPLTC